MRWRKRIRFEREGINLEADVNAALAINQGEQGATNKVESVSHARVVQGPRRPASKSPGSDKPETESDKEDQDD